MSLDDSGEWNVRPPALDTEKSPWALFEGFFTEEVYEFIRVETTVLDMHTQMGSTTLVFL